MRQRKSLFAVLGSIAAACLLTAVAFLPLSKASAAEETKITVSDVLMENGATVRVSGESTNTDYASVTGLRFTMFVDKATYDDNKENAEVGMYLTLTENLTGDKNLTSEAGINAIKAEKLFLGLVKMQEANTSTSKTENEVYEFRVVNTLPESLYGKSITANGYIKIGDTYTFATNPQSRSVAQMADRALDEGADHNDLRNFVDKALTEENFAFENTAFKTDMYKQDTLDVNETIAIDGLTADWESSDETVAKVEDGVITRVGKGTATITATIGTTKREATVTIGDPNALIVDSESYANVYGYDGASYFRSYVDATDAEIANFAGNYQGNATKAKYMNAADGYRLTNKYTMEELTAISEDYNNVSFWIACSAFDSGMITFGSGTPSLATTLGMNNDNGYKFTSTITLANKNMPTETWHRFTISMDKYISLLTQDDGTAADYFFIFSLWDSGVTDTEYLYFGDVEFTSDIHKVNFNGFSNGIVQIGLPGSAYPTTSSFVGAGAEEIANFGGLYEGNARRIVPYANNNYVLRNSYSLEELNVIKEKYNTVSLWLASTALTGGAVYFYAEGATANGATVGKNFLDQAGWATKTISSAPNGTTAMESGKWHKISISIDQYIALVTADDGETALDYCRLFSTWSNATVEGTRYLYFGDIFFENVEQNN